MPQELILPTFTECFFRFDSPDSVPQHIEAEPVSPNFPDLWSLYMASRQKTLNAATDILNPEQAELLATAKRDYLEATIGAYGYTTDVCILSPKGEHTRFYVGRSLSDD